MTAVGQSSGLGAIGAIGALSAVLMPLLYAVIRRECKPGRVGSR
nr:MAG TPA: hypothetical protein [Caudoviricetes sp.]DAQ50081.1 MAG TPA: hypothetical protein [Caudoviricetes sp.]